jgi:hypothetical protein
VLSPEREKRKSVSAYLLSAERTVRRRPGVEPYSKVDDAKSRRLSNETLGRRGRPACRNGSKPMEAACGLV